MLSLIIVSLNAGDSVYSNILKCIPIDDIDESEVMVISPCVAPACCLVFSNSKNKNLRNEEHSKQEQDC